MINRTTLTGLAAATFVLLIVNAALGQDFGEGNAFLWTVSDILWFSFLLCALVLVVLTASVLARAAVRSRRPDRDSEASSRDRPPTNPRGSRS